MGYRKVALVSTRNENRFQNYKWQFCFPHVTQTRDTEEPVWQTFPPEPPRGPRKDISTLRKQGSWSRSPSRKPRISWSCGLTFQWNSALHSVLGLCLSLITWECFSQTSQGHWFSWKGHQVSLDTHLLWRDMYPIWRSKEVWEVFRTASRAQRQGGCHCYCGNSQKTDSTRPVTPTSERKVKPQKGTCQDDTAGLQDKNYTCICWVWMLL